MIGMVERVALALMEVVAASPASPDGKEFPVLSGDPDFYDLPSDQTEGTVDDDITQEAVLRLARAAIAAMRCPTNEMVQAAFNPYGDSIHGDGHHAWEAMIDAALKE